MQHQSASGHVLGHGAATISMSLEQAIVLVYGGSAVPNPEQLHVANSILLQASNDETGAALTNAVRLLQSNNVPIQVHTFAAHLIGEQLHIVKDVEQRKHLQALLLESLRGHLDQSNVDNGPNGHQAQMMLSRNLATAYSRAVILFAQDVEAALTEFVNQFLGQVSSMAIAPNQTHHSGIRIVLLLLSALPEHIHKRASLSYEQQQRMYWKCESWGTRLCLVHILMALSL